ncbi:MAG: L,D-transpeptidase family protein [Planctomycetes bacterium]|nr:L,D-transpeptidase family protein [Planctomycetota bacterium]
MPRFLFVAAIPFFLFACGGEESHSSSDVIEISLDDLEGNESSPNEPNINPGSSGVQAPGIGEVATPPATALKEEIQATPASASKMDPTTALAALDSWHRELTAQRNHLVSGNSALAGELSGFAGIFTGNADAYRGSLNNQSADGFGTDFERFASAWASGGTAGLQRALSKGAVGTAKLVWTDALAELCLATDDYRLAGSALTIVIKDMLSSGYDRERVLELQERVALVGRNAHTFLPSKEYEVKNGDSYWVICRDLRKDGIIAPQGWISEFNHKRNYNLRLGETLKIPTATLEIRAWRGARFMALYADGAPIRLYSVSMGKKGKPTPLGSFTFSTDLLEEPIYYPAGGTSVPYGNPDNPLGERWMGFKEDRQYGIHGTNSEDTIGSFESGGCIRMHNADAKALFELVGSGMKVTIYA